MNTRFLQFALFACSLSSCVSDPGRRTFVRLDDNRDGKVTEAEFAGHVSSEGFRVLDMNGDGLISVPEWTKKESHTSSQALFRAMDANGDNTLSAGEFVAAPGSGKRAEIDAVFHTLDRNHDGGLEWGEVTGP